MRLTLTILVLVSLSFVACDVRTHDYDPNYSKSQNGEAAFPGGRSALSNYINQNVLYPDDAIELTISGRIHVNFIVEKDGSLSNIEAEEEGHLSLRKEAKRLVESMPKWKPGMVKGKPVRTKCRLPVIFTIEGPSVIEDWFSVF